MNSETVFVCKAESKETLCRVNDSLAGCLDTLHVLLYPKAGYPARNSDEFCRLERLQAKILDCLEYGQALEVKVS